MMSTVLFRIAIALNLGLSILFSQTEISSWQGRLDLGVQQLRLVVHLTMTGDSCQATFDSPDQQANGIAFSSCRVKADSTVLMANNIKAAYLGVYKGNDSISGEWNQGGMKLPLNLARKTLAESSGPSSERPQTPVPPFSYEIQDVKFLNSKAGISLSGTLTTPAGKGPFPAVVLISGSGPQNRDEEILGHKPFAVIADYLTRKGYAVLRYDDRGMGSSEGVFEMATTFDFAEDAEAAWNYLSTRDQIQKNAIGLLGHSEGGIVAAIIASRNKKCAFVISMAGPGISHDLLLLEQANAILSTSSQGSENMAEVMAFNKSCYDILKQEKNKAILEARIRKLCDDYFVSGNSDYEGGEKAAKKQSDLMVKTLLSPWFYTFINIEPEKYWKKVKCPVLAINGELDMQVLPVSNLRGIQKSLPKKTKLKSCFIELNKLNHLFQPAITGRPEEYNSINITIEESALNLIADWLSKTIK